MAVYLLHFSSRYKHAGHYMGFTDDVPNRVRQHRSGRGVPLTKAAVAQGIKFVVARVWWTGDRDLERRLRWASHLPKLCPICSAGSENRGKRAYRRKECRQ